MPGRGRRLILRGNNHMKVIVLTSGGLDSACLLHEARRLWTPVLGLSFSYGAKHNAREIPFAAAQCEAAGVPHAVISLDFIPTWFKSALLLDGGPVPDGHYRDATMRDTVVPFRNGIMLAVAAGMAESLGAGAVAIAAHAGDHAIYPDCRQTFMRAMNDAMRAGTYAGIELLCPFADIDKAGIVARGVELKVDFAATWSCYKGGETHCGTCGTCVERREAFAAAGVNDPTIYASP